jgi:hypothetical protein
MHGDDGVDEIATEAPEARKRSILVRAGEPAISGDIRNQHRRELSGLAHRLARANGTLARRR